jgi:filamentous hemagglutinin
MRSNFFGTVGWEISGSALIYQINGDDPLVGAITGGLDSAAGFRAGKIISSETNAAGKWNTGGWNPKFDPQLLKYTEIKGQLGIAKEILPSKYPSGAGNLGASYATEKAENAVQEQINSVGVLNQ